MDYYVYENWRVRPTKARVHRGECSWCNYGKGIHPDPSGRNSKWHGPFNNLHDAIKAAKGIGHPLTLCKKCNPG